MKPLYQFFFLFSALYLTLKTFQITEIPLPDWITFYAADFLCMPIVLSICLWFTRKIKQDNSLTISLFAIFSLSTLYALYFEALLPQFHTRYTADPIDALLYFMGSLLFYVLQKKIIAPQKESKKATCKNTKSERSN